MDFFDKLWDFFKELGNIVVLSIIAFILLMIVILAIFFGQRDTREDRMRMREEEVRRREEEMRKKEEDKKSNP